MIIIALKFNRRRNLLRKYKKIGEDNKLRNYLQRKLKLCNPSKRSFENRISFKSFKSQIMNKIEKWRRN